MKPKKTRLILRLAVLAIALYMALNVLNLQLEIGRTQQSIDELSQSIEYQKMENAMLDERVKDGMDDETVKAAARSELGMVEPGEEVFMDVSN